EKRSVFRHLVGLLLAAQVSLVAMRRKALRFSALRCGASYRGGRPMKTTFGWLKSHLDTAAPLEEIVRRLVMLGLEVESVAHRAAALAPFRVAHVVSAEPHPDADR